MRVNLTYSVALEEVESRVADLIRESSNKTKQVAETLDKVATFLGGGQSSLTRMELDKIRMELARIDTRLADCESILYSYSETIQQIQDQQLGSLAGPVFHEEEGIENDEEG
jgi:hypothetical protein